MRILRPLLVFSTGASLVLLPAPAQSGQMSKFAADMTAEESVPVPGPPGAKGQAKVQGDPETGRVCYQLTYNGPGEVTDVHIHRAPKGANGPVTIRLDAKAPCVDADPAEVQALRDWPGGPEQGYFVDFHTAAYQAPNGAVRGQLFFD